MKAIDNSRIILLLFLFICLSGCGDDWRDPLGMSRAGNGSDLNPDGTPFLPAPGHIDLNNSSLENIKYRSGSAPLKTMLQLKNTGTEDLVINNIELSEEWISISGVDKDYILKPFDSLEVWIKIGNTSLANGIYTGSVSFVWNSLDNPDSTASFNISLMVGDNSAWDIIYNDTIVKNCSCHLTASGAGGLIMNTNTAAYNDIYEVFSKERPDEYRIKAYYPDQSYFYRKLTGIDIVPKRMPRDGPPFLSDNYIEEVRIWILTGGVK